MTGFTSPLAPTTATQLTLTFDDGYASWHRVRGPPARGAGIPAVFFVSSGLVGLRGERAREFARLKLRRTRELEFISLRDLEELAAHRLFEVGGHTRNHVDLGRVSDRQHREGGDRRRSSQVGGLARKPGEVVRVPVRDAGERLAARPVRWSMSSGSTAAFTLVPGWWEPGRGDRLSIGRDGVDPAVSFGVWRAWLRGGYDRLYRLKPERAPTGG